MSQYRRAYQPGGTFFFTLVAYRRRPLFANTRGLKLLRETLRAVRAERPFEVVAAAVLPDHLHVIWTLPAGDADFSSRIGQWKVLFTRGLRAAGLADRGESASASRRKHRESDVWQRRFWEHLVRDEDDLNQHLDYIHYNPVKHGLTACPHAYAASSFGKWVRRDAYRVDWLCTCDGSRPSPPTFSGLLPEDFD